MSARRLARGRRLRLAVPGLEVTLDGQPHTSPITVLGVVGRTRNLSVAPQQVVGGVTYQFTGWSDGGSATHDIAFPESDTIYTANYQAQTDYYLSDRDWV